jgi:hypothetical protein
MAYMYDNMTLNELKSEARKQGLSGYSSARKDDIVYALSNGLQRVEPNRQVGTSRERYNSNNSYNYNNYSNTNVGGSRDRSNMNNMNRVGNYRSNERSNYNYMNRVGHNMDKESMLKMKTLTDLRSKARELRVPGYYAMRKEELIDALLSMY